MNQLQQETRPGGNKERITPSKTPELPIEAHRDAIIEAITTSPSTVLVGETGSGKTTKTPLFLLSQFPEATIAVTSPRVLPARSVSKYVAGQIGERVGGTVGVVTRDKRETGPDTRCLFMTDGVLLNMLRKDPSLSELDIVMVDEAHERGLNVDLSLGLLKRAQKLRKEQGLPELKIVVASATLEEKKFTDYFQEAPLVKVPGRMFPVEVSYHPFKDSGEVDQFGRKKDYTNHAAEVAKSVLADSSKDGDILIFMPGEAEIMRTIEHLRKTCAEEVELLPLFGSMNPQDQDRIFEKNGKRKVIVATNIAETSVTIDTVRHVIDTGYNKEKRYDPITGIDMLALHEASQANMEQRKGRAGRVSSGWCYRLVDEKNFNERDSFTKPEILRSNLAEVVLKMKDMGINDVEGFEFIDQPSKEAIHDAITQLTALGALDLEGKITDLGKEMAELPLEPGLSRAVIEAKKLGCLELMIDVAAMFSTSKQLFFKGKSDDPEQFEKESRQYSLKVRGSDYLTALNVWRKWNEDNCSTQFAIDHLVNIKALREAGQVRDLLLRTLGDVGVEGQNSSDLATEKENITRCLLVSKPNSIFYGHQSSFNRWTVWSVADKNSLGRKETSIFPGSSCFKVVSDSEFLIGEDINKNDKGVTYLRRCHAISLDEIKKVAPHLVSEKDEKGYGNSLYKVTTINGVEVARKYVTKTQSDSEYGYGLPPSYHSFYGNRDSVYQKPEERAISVYEVGDLMVGRDSLTRHNSRILNTVREYELKCRDITAVDEQLWQNRVRDDIAHGEIKTIEDAKGRLGKYTLSLDDFISQEKREEIDRLSPSTVTVGGVTVPVVYELKYVSYNQPHERVASVTFNLDTVTQIMNGPSRSFDISFPLIDKTVFKYKYYAPSPYSDMYTLHSKIFPSFKELVQFAMTNTFEVDSREKIVVASGGLSREERDQLFGSVPKDSLYTLQGNLDTKEKKERLATRVGILRSLLTVVSEYIDGVADSKTKNKINAQIISMRKELRGISEAIESYKGNPVKVEQVLRVIFSCEGLLSGNDMLGLLGVLDKRYLGLVYINILSLEQAALEGDVEVSDELTKKIIKKALNMTIGDRPVKLDQEGAGDTLIDLI